MRQRETVVIDRRTGAVTGTVEQLPDASFEERAAELKASAPDIGPVEGRIFSVRCDGDGCGTSAGVDFDRPQLPAGWVTREDGEFCPACK